MVCVKVLDALELFCLFCAFPDQAVKKSTTAKKRATSICHKRSFLKKFTKRFIFCYLQSNVGRMTDVVLVLSTR